MAAPAGLGLDGLRAALGRTLRVTPAVADTGRPRLWVDRAFAVKGAGTIVTGTLLVTHVWPFAAVFVTTGTARSLYALVLLTILFVYLVGSRFTRLPWPFAALHPVGTAILVYAILEAAFKATVQGGIRWRGTFYGLGELKKNKG